VPRLTRFELRMQVDLVRDDRMYAEFDTNGLLRGDAKSRNEALEIQRRNGVINANQWADRENLNPIDGEGGDTYFVPMNWAPMDKLATAPLHTKQPQPATEEPKPNAQQ
jgi:phage portal protein BeeE